MTENVKGPASYFPSIERKYGRPIAEWKEFIRSSPLTKHMEPFRATVRLLAVTDLVSGRSEKRLKRPVT